MREANNQNLFALPQKAGADAGEKAAAGGDSMPRRDELGDDTSVEVRFCTGGRLSAPPVLHFHDYSMMASQALAELPSAEDHLPIIVRVLNSMVVEDFDCGLLHVEEAKEALLNVYAKWWGPTLTGFRYLLDPDIKDEAKLAAKENISVADIPIASIAAGIKPLGEGIREPINIRSHGVTARFVYPRIRNSGVTAELLKEKFADEEQRFARTRQALEFNARQDDPAKMKDVDPSERDAFEAYRRERDKWRMIYTRAQEICGVDGESFGAFDARVDAILNDARVGVRHWRMYADFLEGDGSFGVKDEATFYSDVLGKEVVRPFRFYTWSFIPSDSVERARDVDDSISFG